MEIKRIRIDFMPCEIRGDKYSTFRVEARIDDEVYNVVETLETDIFTSAWDAITSTLMSRMQSIIEDKVYG